MLIKKKVEDYTNAESEEVFSHLKEYLKRSGEVLEVGGRKVKYIDYLIVREIEDQLYGFEDELVFVCETWSGNKRLDDTYLGMHERTLTSNAKKNFLREIEPKTLERIIVGQLASKALYEYNTRKDRGDKNGN